MRTGWKLVHHTIAALSGLCLLDRITHVKKWTGYLRKPAVFHFRCPSTTEYNMWSVVRATHSQQVGF